LSHGDDSARLLIEQFDDISIESDESFDLHQTKLHTKSVANLTDASADLWKTIRIWSEGIASKKLDPELCIFFLVTTAKASINTICFDLKYDTLEDRDVVEIT